MPRPAARAGYGFGTFQGVFTPSLLTILGVVMYLRFGWVLGNVGLGLTLVIVTLATTITFVTGLSISALATNMRVGAGGAYFLISRSFGVEVGAAVGLPLYLAQALGISFYVAGFAESVHAIAPALPETGIAVVALFGIAALAYFSADLALKSQFFILVTILASLAVFFGGDAPVAAAPVTDAPPPEAFWVVFAVFFPAVTGIEAGVALSGDLKDPARSLPRGTLGAIGAGYIIYMAIPIFLSQVVHDAGWLRSNPMVMRDIALVPQVVIAGLWGASLSSALGAMLGAPRTLQALSRDRILPAFFGRGSGPSDDPRIATAISFGVALVGVLAGGLNVIGPVLSMFFLTSYGLLNMASGFAGLIGSATWRPGFKVPALVSLFGAAACLVTMMMIDPGATVLATLVCGGVFWVMQRRRLRAHFGDIRRGLSQLAAQHAILNLARTPPDERNWRPNILVLSGSPSTRGYLVELASALAKGRGLVSVAAVVPADATPPARAMQLESSIAEHLRRRELPALTKVHPAQDPLTGMGELVRAYGFGPIVPNVIMLGDTTEAERFEEYAALLIEVCRSQRNIVVVRERDGVLEIGAAPRIDIWWGGQPRNAYLMLALSLLLTRSDDWDEARIVLHTVVEAEGEQDAALQRIEQMLLAWRIEADFHVHLRGERSVFECITEESQGASLVFMGLRAPRQEETAGEYAEYYAGLMAAISGIETAALVLAAEDLDFSNLFMEV